MKSRTEARIEMAEKMLKATPGYCYNPTLLEQLCGEDYIPDGELIAQRGDEKLFYEGGAFVTKNDGKEVRRFEKDQLPKDHQEQSFCAWAAKKATIPQNV